MDVTVVFVGFEAGATDGRDVTGETVSSPALGVVSVGLRPGDCSSKK